MIRTDDHWLSITDAFYSAAIDGQGWYGALDGLAKGTGSRVGELIGIGPANTVPFNYVTDLGQDWLEEFIAIGGADPRVNPFVRVGSQIPVMKVMASHEFVTTEERRFSPFFAEHATRHDINHICLTPLIKERETLVGLAVIRSKSQGEINAQQRKIFSTIAPHVRAAVRMQMTLEQQGALLMTNTLEALSLAAFVCDRCGTVKALTPAAEAVVSVGEPLRLRQGQLNTVNPDEMRMLSETLRAATEGLVSIGAPLPGTVVLHGNGFTPMVLEVLHLPRREYSFGFEPRALVIVRSGQADNGRMKGLMRMAYGLTDTEAEVALILAEGKSPEMIALSRGTSLGTVRTQLRSVYIKLGVSRQNELVARLNQLR